MALEPFLGTGAQKAFFFTVIIQAIVVLTMVGITYGMVAGEDLFDTSVRYKTLPCYLALFALAEIFEVFMVFDALRLRNIIQLFGVTSFHLALMVIGAIQVPQTRDALVSRSAAECARRFDWIECDGPGTLFWRVRPFLIVAPVIIGVSLLILGWYLKELYSEFGWAIFHVVGANPRMKTMYQYYQIMICLLKFDFFFFTGVTMQLLILVLKSSSAEFGITVAAIPIVLILLVLCGLAVQREIKWIMSISLVMMLASLSYLRIYAHGVARGQLTSYFIPVYKLVRFYQPQNAELYSTTRASLTIFTIVAFLLLFTSFGIGLRCFFDFDKGLAPSKIHSAPTKRPPLQSKESSGLKPDTSGIPLGPRISIE
ncbi:hypothetical protein FA13DRAFT_1204002 [Coprinellus micaceus]|uniref:Uncharacterized protein n=1 Tax=Coprinellus micaceus TaxID=71717 RepID=A0A4Y7TNW9_COPMI|nr:hypothetical protein FA13DRAFT_1204002 [Coprinellus micaceus]